MENELNPGFTGFCGSYIFEMIYKSVWDLKTCSSQVADLLGKHPDLLEGFGEFLERCEQDGKS